MTSRSCDGLIKEGDQVVVRIEKNLKVVPVRRNSKLWIERSKFYLDSAIGFPYGSSFHVVDQKLTKAQIADPKADVDLDNEEDEDSIRDNRNLKDTNSNQKLSSDEIRSMKKDGMQGEEIIEQLIQNSATFNQKNDFAKQKYIKKKKKKYVPVVSILKPTARLLLEMYYNKGPSRICNLRVDSLGQILTYVNARAHSKLMVVESCVGLVVGAVMERMGGHGTVIQLYSGSAAVQQAVVSFDFPKEAHDNLHDFPLSHVNRLSRHNVSHWSAQSIASNTESPDEASSNTKHSENTSTKGHSDIQCSSSQSCQVPTTDSSNDVVDMDTEGICDSSTLDKTQENGDQESQTQQTVDTQEAASVCVSQQTHVTDDQETKGIKRKCPDSSTQHDGTPCNKEEREKKAQMRRDYIEKVKGMIEQCDSDGLIVVTKFHPTPIVMSLIDFVQPSRPIAVFCQYKEPLMDLYTKLRDRGGVVLLRMSETWLRGYQVLRERTHPKINMSGTGGYLLTGTTVELDKT